MSPSPVPQVRLSIVAAFPKKYFLKNLAIRADNSVLVTALNHKELWHVPASPNGIEVAPQLLFTFPHLAMGIVEVMPDVFYITTSEIYTWSASHLYRLDLNGWTPGSGLNGSCVVAPGLILLADCFSSWIWRVDLNMRDGKPKANVWLRHDSMSYFPGQMKPEQPGVNGVQYSPSATIFTTPVLGSVKSRLRGFDPMTTVASSVAERSAPINPRRLAILAGLSSPPPPARRQRLLAQLADHPDNRDGAGRPRT
jgi:hypothetical protein